jgi:hypothetical protein
VKSFPVNVEVEEDVRMFQIPTAVYQSLMADLPEWKDFIINTLYDRLLESLQVIESRVFTRRSPPCPMATGAEPGQGEFRLRYT